MEQWFQVDLRKTTNVSAVASQGDILDGNWVTEYALNYSCDGVKWFSYTYQGAPVVSHIMITIYRLAFSIGWFSSECRKTETKVVSLANHKFHRQSS